MEVQTLDHRRSSEGRNNWPGLKLSLNLQLVGTIIFHLDPIVEIIRWVLQFMVHRTGLKAKIRCSHRDLRNHQIPHQIQI